MENYRIKQRNIVLCIIFSIITCGIYSIYWMIVLNDDTKSLSGDFNAASGGLVLLFTIITCGIYGIYWLYKLGQRVDNIKKNQNGSTGLLFLILGIFGLGIVAYAIAQDAVNNCSGTQDVII